MKNIKFKSLFVVLAGVAMLSIQRKYTGGSFCRRYEGL